MGYRTGSHTKYKIEYHFVWVTKYRYQVLKGDVAERARELVRQTCANFEIEIIRGVVRKTASIYWYRRHRRSARRTSAKLFEEFPYIKKRYWDRHFWARGSFSITAGELTKKMIEEYLAHHFEVKANANFKIEE
jgi:putative transposase